MSVSKFLRKLALRLHRTPQADSQANGPDWFKISLLAICILPFFAVYGMQIVQIIRGWQTLTLEVQIPAKQWKVLYQPVTNDASLASPHNLKLWNSEYYRDNPKHTQLLKEAEGKEVWVGTVMSVEQLKLANEKQANIFILGRIGGSFNLWIDGEKYMSGSRRDASPIEVALPFERLKKAEPLYIAVQIFHDSHHPYPDYFNGFSIGEGLATRTQYSMFANYDRFVSGTRMYGLMLLNFAFAFFFFTLWRASPVKQEYFYVAFYSLLHGFGHLRYIELIFSRLTPETNALADVMLRFLEGGFAMLLGLSYSRLRNKLLKAATALVFIPPLIIFLMHSDATSLFHIYEWISKIYIPLCCAIGAGACLLQAWYLHGEKNRGLFLPLRLQRLAYFSGALLIIALLNSMPGSAIISKYHLSKWFRFAHFALLGFLGHIVFREYKDQSRLVEKTPVSEYHRRPELPAQIWGALIIADLKSSEFFYRHRAEKNPTGDTSSNVVSLWRSHFCTTVLKYGGTVVGQKGDEILAFFDQQNSEPSELRAFLCTQEMVEASKLLERDLQNKGLYPTGAPSLLFRAALTHGAIRPVWEELGGGERIPYWEEASNTTPFVHLSRILEFEKTLPESKSTSLLVLDELISQKLYASNCVRPDQRLYEGLEKTDKNNRAYKVHVYKLGKAHQPIDTKGKKAS